MSILKPNLETAPDYFKRYISLCQEDDLIDAFNNSELETTNLFKTFIELEKENYRYQETKWTVKEVLVHIIECERIFAYRALRFSRRDATALMGFDENEYIPNSNTSSREISKILLEYLIVRKVLLYNINILQMKCWILKELQINFQSMLGNLVG